MTIAFNELSWIICFSSQRYILLARYALVFILHIFLISYFFLIFLIVFFFFTQYASPTVYRLVHVNVINACLSYIFFNFIFASFLNI